MGRPLGGRSWRGAWPGRHRAAVAGLALLLLVTGAPAGPSPAAAQEAAGAGLDSLTRARIDALSADAGTPAYQDGFAGLLVMHAGRDPERARAMARYALARTPASRNSVARALAMAGHRDATDALDGPSGAAGAPGAGGRDGGSLGLPGWPIGFRPFGLGQGGSGGGASGGGGFSAPGGGGGSAQISIRDTLRPGPDGLATPQLR